jgi:mercuric ion transport protein
MEETTARKPACGSRGADAGVTAFGAGVTGALISGLLASACCVGPLLAVFLGVTGAGLLLALEPYRPWFAALMAAFLGFGFYRAYWLPRVAARKGSACWRAGTLRAQKVVLWLATALALGLFFVPDLLLLALE